MFRATCWSDTPRSLAFVPSETLKVALERLAGATPASRSASILDHPRSNPYAHEFSFPLVKKVWKVKRSCVSLTTMVAGTKKEPNFQYNNYQQKSYPNNQQSGYPPRNNQQGSYQPQQNPSSGSSASQESSTDTLLKQILESQTRSEKHVGYELKNLHTKIDGSYNELNNKFSHLASTVFEYHMEFLETFGCIWSSKEVIRVVFGRALPGATSQSDYMRSLCTTSRSDSSIAFSHPETHIFDRATC
ncbi:hypothetical protein IGI04_036839 [Brassica rapa subsp. trilocularis]|uniref:Uncharacterized protein n=1 Tax=Brassica rapa subsp. trilocularis TaxID=1813537 RepID=A0ABQ7LFM2_BRACM|nr:hypothetical protein IGI04_036839 [Brassica rapa subsp. trilocularis]